MRKRVIETAEEMGYKASKTASSLSRRPIKFGAIINNNSLGFMREIERGMRSVISDLADFNVSGDINITRRDSDKQEYEEMITRMVENGYDGIAIVPSAIESGFEDLISYAKARGVIIGTVVSDFPFSKRDLSVRNNGVVAGQIAAQLLHWLVDDAPVALVTGFRDSIVHKETITGFQNYISGTSMNFAGIFEHRDDPEIAYYLASRMIKERPDIKGVYFGTANSISFCKRLEECGRMQDIRIVASDLLPEIIEKIKNGVISATIFQNPYAQGKTLIEIMYKMIAENYKLENDIYYLDPYPIFKSNLGLYL
jgi:LacI family transcriptional regulator